MLALSPWRKTLKEVLAAGKLSAEDELKAELLARPIIRFRHQPAMMLISASGIVVPPHERLMLWQVALGAPENVNVSGRATSKSTAWCVLGATMLSMLVPRKKHVTLSATGFRGGQSIFNDIERWATGQWDSQLDGHAFVAASIVPGTSSKALVHRAQNFWEIKFGSYSILRTLPTNNEDKIRGERAQVVWNDEANTTEESLIAEVVRPFMGVKGGFDSGGADSAANSIYFTTTIDYGWRPFIKIQRASREGLQRDWDFKQAVKDGNMELQAALRKQGLLKYTYTCYDYTDTILREEQVDRQGRRYQVVYPNANEVFGRKKFYFREFELGIPFTTRGADGRMQRDGTPTRALTTYPFDLTQIEGPLYDGTTDESVWLRESRNVLDTATGDVYPHGLLDKVACVGQNAIISWEDMPKEWTEVHGQRGYFAPVMFECSDPCVLGVDVADGARDFAAFVVIRVGPLASGAFNPLGVTSLGNTEWSNVVWSEQHRHMSYREIAEKIKEMRQRYNLVFFHEPWKKEEDHCRAIGLDKGGGGRAVRDSLLFLDRSESERGGDVIIYDPGDDEDKIEAVKNDKSAVPMLDLINATDQLYDQLVEFSLGQMKVGRLYLPKWLDESLRPDRNARLNAGYLGAKVIDSQLRKLQQEPTARGRKFFIPSGTTDAQKHKAATGNDPSKKKDSWAAFMYAIKQHRVHLARHKLITTKAPSAGAIVVKINSHRGRHHGRAPGARL